MPCTDCFRACLSKRLITANQDLASWVYPKALIFLLIPEVRWDRNATEKLLAYFKVQILFWGGGRGVVGDTAVGYEQFIFAL